MTTLKELLVEGSRYELSLKRVLDQPIADVLGYVSNEFGEPTFKLTRLVLGNGVSIRVEGEHDFPYLTPYEDAPAGIQHTSLKALYAQSKE